MLPPPPASAWSCPDLVQPWLCPLSAHGHSGVLLPEPVIRLLENGEVVEPWSGRGGPARRCHCLRRQGLGALGHSSLTPEGPGFSPTDQATSPPIPGLSQTPPHRVVCELCVSACIRV